MLAKPYKSKPVFHRSIHKLLEPYDIIEFKHILKRAANIQLMDITIEYLGYCIFHMQLLMRWYSRKYNHRQIMVIYEVVKHFFIKEICTPWDIILGRSRDVFTIEHKLQ